MQRFTSTLREAIDKAILLLSEGKFDELEQLTNGRRLTAEEIRRAVAGYGKTICAPQDNRDADIVSIKGSTRRAWSVWVPLNTKEEGRSDLTLQLRLAERDDGTIETQIDGLHVL